MERARLRNCHVRAARDLHGISVAPCLEHACVTGASVVETIEGHENDTQFAEASAYALNGDIRAGKRTTFPYVCVYDLQYSGTALVLRFHSLSVQDWPSLIKPNRVANGS